MADIGAFLSSLGAKITINNEWLFPECWYCQGKDKLYFNSAKLVGYCQKCPRIITLRDIAVDLAGIGVGKIAQFVDDQRINDAHELGFREAILQALMPASTIGAERPLSEIPLPDSFRTLRDGQQSVIGRKAIAYMVGRGFNLHRLFEMGFGYCSEGKYANRVIIPFTEEGRLVYWQARDFTGKVPVEEKILNPKDTPHGKSSVLFNYDTAKEHDFIILTESWGSSLAVGDVAMGLNGKSLSETQLSKLLALECSSVVVMMDHGAEGEAWKIAAKLYNHKNTLLAFLPYGDPNEVPRQVWIKSVKQAQRYSTEDHIRYLVMSK